MDIYVHSRGFDQDKDYCWLKITGDGSPKRQLPPLSDKVVNVIQSDAPSVLLERLQDEYLLLLITGIEPEGRVDFLDRQIRISVVWLGDNSDELALRQLAARALKEQERIVLTAKINQAVILLKDPTSHQVAPNYISDVKLALHASGFPLQQDLAQDLELSNDTISQFFNGEPINYRNFIKICKRLNLDWKEIKEDGQSKIGDEITQQQTYVTMTGGEALSNDAEAGFQVSHTQMLKLSTVDQSESLLLSNPPNLTKKIGKNSPKLRQELAEELQQYYLPSETGIIVVVTGIKKRETLEEAGVWRSLSTLVNTEGDKWEEIYFDLSIEAIIGALNYEDMVQRPFLVIQTLLESREKIIAYLLTFFKKMLS